MNLSRRYPEIAAVLLVIALVLVTIFLTWANYRYSVQNPGGSDLVPRWVGIRQLLLTGESPYSEATTRQIHQMFYGRPARSDEDQVLFVYPLYSILLFAPFALIPDFNTARAVFMTVLEIAVVLNVAASLALLRWKLPPVMLGLILLFAALWYYSVRSLINANVSLLLSLLVVAALLAIRAEQDALAGAILAFTTIKPQMVVLLILFVMIWAISQRRYVLFWSIIGSTVLLAGIGVLLIQDWIWQNMVQVVAYPGYTLPTTPTEIFQIWVPGVAKQLGRGLTVTIIVMLIMEWRDAWGKEFKWMFWTACLTLVVTPLVGIPAATENYMVMFPALMLVFMAWEDHWGSWGRVLVLGSLLLLFVGIWWLFLSTVEIGEQAVQGPVMFFPLPVFLIITLYWVKWWVLRPEQPLFDRLRRTTLRR